ncbi:Mixed-amyrin synthase [Pisum sativum] [Rhizoctonia solani]|uniref:Mixed-amyrin synthase [Pisum sativum] n=1 Tax=Rhizoctonia solani TaxID=456999 RepID=A0A0K6FR18_9AGAM|nr:Mixed-amyrin synthase [Pisum sativum] [Rhizoctonia solani]
MYHRWGRNISQYPKSYNTEALAANIKTPVAETKRGTLRELALGAIQEIRNLADVNVDQRTYTDIISGISLEKLKAVLAIAHFRGGLDNFTSPKLIAGCIELMSSVQPSPFLYEYGYVCFRLLNIALSACLIKRACESKETFTVPKKDFLNNSASALWDICAFVISEELSGNTGISSGVPHSKSLGYWTAPLLEKSRLDRLLTMLHADQQNFTVALTETKTLGLSGLIYVLWKFVESEEVDMDRSLHQEWILRPFLCILFRYWLAMPHFNYEFQAMRRIYFPKDPSLIITYGQPINLEDSINVIRAYSTLLESHESIELMDCGKIMSFITPFVTIGCEDLVPDMFMATIRVLWKRLLVPKSEAHHIVMSFVGLMEGFIKILTRLRVSSADTRPWTTKLARIFVDNDVLDLVLRLTLITPTQMLADPTDYRAIMIQPKYVTRALVSIVRMLPNQYLVRCFRESAAFYDWKFYLEHFELCTSRDPMRKAYPMENACNTLLVQLCDELLGKAWSKKISAARPSGTCNYPRCPSPFGAEFTSFESLGALYCSTRCQAE